MVRSHLATMHRLFMSSAYFFMSSEMGCMVTSVTVHTLRQKEMTKERIVVAKCERTLKIILKMAKKLKMLILFLNGSNVWLMVIG